MFAGKWIPALAGMTLSAAFAQPIYDDPRQPPERDTEKEVAPKRPGMS